MTSRTRACPPRLLPLSVRSSASSMKRFYRAEMKHAVAQIASLELYNNIEALDADDGNTLNTLGLRFAMTVNRRFRADMSSYVDEDTERRFPMPSLIARELQATIQFRRVSNYPYRRYRVKSVAGVKIHFDAWATST